MSFIDKPYRIKRPIFNLKQFLKTGNQSFLKKAGDGFKPPPAQ
jgi:hypothetical protein